MMVGRIMVSLFKKYSWCLFLVTLFHMMVDFSTVYITYAFLSPPAEFNASGDNAYLSIMIIYTIYNFLAFVLQAPLG